MLAPHLKSKVDLLWNKFWTAGITNPLVAIEQITYLLFLKRLEGIDLERVEVHKQKTIYATKPLKLNQKTKGDDSNIETIHHPKADTCRWSNISTKKSIEHLNSVVFPWLRDLEKILKVQTVTTDAKDETETIGNRMSDAYFQLDPNKGEIFKDAIKLIDQLFSHVDTKSVDDDLMGDIFEYLLSEISSSGKNGQFRTPRHIIRVLVELLNPEPEERIIDPAAGTSGFLFSAMSYLLKQGTPDDTLKLEWEGTPHRADGTDLKKDQYAAIHQGNYYIGLDNDRTMVRIGWMNMILHGVQNPQIHQRDSLGKIKDDDPLFTTTLKSESFSYVLANPPFTGTVDKDALDLTIYPKVGTTATQAKLAITDKSELLFVWRMLDFLEVGGRCAVIIPEGILFGGTKAHTQLRKELLTEHTVEAIISLPSGAFQPYTGVKTSIIVFQKNTSKAEKENWKTTENPRTHRVWFYEVEQEAFTLDAKRTERKGQDNDLWDMLEKFKQRDNTDTETLDYYQPEYWLRRWRLIEEDTLKKFPDNKEVSANKGKVVEIQELFPKLPADPVKATQQIETAQRPQLMKIAEALLAKELEETSLEGKSGTEIKTLTLSFRRLFSQFKDQFENENSLAIKIFQQACKESEKELITKLKARDRPKITAKPIDEKMAKIQMKDIAYAYAQLDGYDVMLRSIEVFKREKALKESKSWWADVRTYAKNDSWESGDGKLKGSHDKNGKVRLGYMQTIDLYDEKGKLNTHYLDPDCIEAKSWSLSAGQYKSFNFSVTENEQSVAEMILELQGQEEIIMIGLEKLKVLVEKA